MSQGKGAIELFPQVTKLVASNNPEIKRIVHRYLIQVKICLLPLLSCFFFCPCAGSRLALVYANPSSMA